MLDRRLAELAACGVALRNPADEHLLAGDDSSDRDGFLRRMNDEDAYLRIMLSLGDEQYDDENDQELPPLSDDVWHFDHEAIENPGDYVRIFSAFSRLSGSDVVFERLVDHVDLNEGIAWVEWTHRGETQRYELDFNDDWVDPNVFEYFEALLKAVGSEQRIITIPFGQDGLHLCKTQPEAEALGKLIDFDFGWSA